MLSAPRVPLGRRRRRAADRARGRRQRQVRRAARSTASTSTSTARFHDRGRRWTRRCSGRCSRCSARPRRRRVHRARIVDWGLAERSASLVIARAAGSRSSPTGAVPYRAAEVGRRMRRGDRVPSAEYAGLGEVADAPGARAASTAAPGRANALATLAEVAEPIERRLADELSLPGPLGTIARRGAGAAIGAEAGLAAGYAGRRVLGQYDVAIVGRVRPARLAVRRREPGGGKGAARRRSRALPALGRAARDALTWSSSNGSDG